MSELEVTKGWKKESIVTVMNPISLTGKKIKKSDYKQNGILKYSN